MCRCRVLLIAILSQNQQETQTDTSWRGCCCCFRLLRGHGERAAAREKESLRGGGTLAIARIRNFITISLIFRICGSPALHMFCAHTYNYLLLNRALLYFVFRFLHQSNSLGSRCVRAIVWYICVIRVYVYGSSVFLISFLNTLFFCPAVVGVIFASFFFTRLLFGNRFYACSAACASSSTKNRLFFACTKFSHRVSALKCILSGCHFKGKHTIYIFTLILIIY